MRGMAAKENERVAFPGAPLVLRNHDREVDQEHNPKLSRGLERDAVSATGVSRFAPRGRPVKPARR